MVGILRKESRNMTVFALLALPHYAGDLSQPSFLVNQATGRVMMYFNRTMSIFAARFDHRAGQEINCEKTGYT